MTDRPPRNEAELIQFIRSIDTPAPDTLHRRVQALIERRAGAGSRARRGARGSGATTRRASPARRLAAVGALVAVAIAAAAIALGGGGAKTLDLHQATALALLRPTAPAPKESPRENGTLAAQVEGVSFPYWEDRFGWRSTGARSGSLDGRAVKTVYYSDNGQRIGYTIFSGAGAPHVSGGTIETRGHTPYRMLEVGGHPVITWVRDGHLCVVSGRGVDSATLLRLASWTDHNTLS
jgi:hypothetical protein